MMPSRGLQLARGHAPRLYQLQCRNLSSASRRIPQTPLRNTLRVSNKSHRWHAPNFAPPITFVAIRHASSTPQGPAPATSTPDTSPPDVAATTTFAESKVAEPTSFPNLDTISLDDIDVTPIADIPEKIGYLQEIGLTYGYGFTSTLEWTIEHLHIWGGLPWWGSIATTAVLMRLFLFPLYLRSSDQMARSAALSSVVKPFTDRINEAKKAGDQQGMMMAYQEMMATRKRAGLSMTKQFTPIVLQGFLAFCGFRLIRAMASLPVPALTTEGPLWLQDLTVSDPYLVLPIVMAVSIHLLVRMGGETGAASTNTISPAMQNVMLYGMPAIIVFAMGYQSGALCIWFAAGGVMGIGQSLLLQRPTVRRFFGIAALYKPTKAEQGESIFKNPFERTSTATATIRPPMFSAGKNEAYMNPTYQSPNLRRSAANKTFKRPGEVIDVKASTRTQHTQISMAESHDREMVQANSPPQSLLSKASNAWKTRKEAKQEGGNESVKKEAKPEPQKRSQRSKHGGR